MLIEKRALLKSGKWSLFLRAPPVLRKILKNKRISRLDSVAEVFRGPTTGYREFFVLSNDDAKKWKIETKFLMSCVSSPKKVTGFLTKKKEIMEYLFVVGKPKNELARTNALKYIEYGETLEVQPKKGSNRKRRRIPKIETLARAVAVALSFCRTLSAPVISPF